MKIHVEKLELTFRNKSLKRIVHLFEKIIQINKKIKINDNGCMSMILYIT